MTINERLNRLLRQAGSVPIAEKQMQAISDAYATALMEIQNELAKLYEKYGTTVPIEKMYERNRLIALRAKITDLFRKASAKAHRAIKGTIEQNLKEGYAWDGYAYSEVLSGGAGVKLSFADFNPELTLASVKNPKDKITGYIYKQIGADGRWHWENSLRDYNAKAFNIVNQRITQGLIQGKGYAEVAREIKGALFGKQKHQFNMTSAIQRIARTEGQKARSLADLVSYENLVDQTKPQGIGFLRIWRATIDNRTRPEHVALDGTPEDKDGNFTFSDGTVTPGPNLSGDPGHDINCRCTTTMAVEGLKTTYQDSNVASKLTPEGFEAYKANGYRRVA